MDRMALSKRLLRLLNLLFFLSALAFTVMSLQAAETSKTVNTDESGVAIKGFDTVAYFLENRARKGSKEFEYIWQGVRWRFASAAHRELFVANPDKYMPQYGGH